MVELADTPDLGSGSARIGGSSPLARTTFSYEIEGLLDSRTGSAQNLVESELPNMKFPKVIRHRKAEVTIYGKKANYPYYRIAYRVTGKRHLRNFSKYGEALKEAEKKVRELAAGSQAAALTAHQSRDALTAFEILEAFRQSSGRRISMSAAISELVEMTNKLKGRRLSEAVEGFLQTAATVQRKDVSQAIEDFLEGRKHKAETKEGKRSQLSASYETHVSSWLRGFAKGFPATAVCDLTKEHINLYFKPLTDVGAKNRNDRRTTLKMFLSWATRQDYLSGNHRLFEANSLTRETVEAADTDFYRLPELQKILDNASADLRPVIAMAGLAGLRGEEIMRLDWADVWRVEGHIEITARQAKTRQRRLVQICPALGVHLEPYRKKTGNAYLGGIHVFHREFTELRGELKIPARRNGLRHAFCTYHFALHANENLTAQQSGNSPAMIHQHYKGLATKAEAEKWFAAMPKKSG